MLTEYLDNLGLRELGALANEVRGRVEATIAPEGRERQYREVVQLMKTLEDLEDDPDCREA